MVREFLIIFAVVWLSAPVTLGIVLWVVLLDLRDARRDIGPWKDKAEFWQGRAERIQRAHLSRRLPRV